MSLFKVFQCGLVCKNSREYVDAVDQYASHPPQVVQADVVVGDLARLGVRAGREHDAATHSRRRIADSEHAIAKNRLHRLGDDSCRVGEVHDVSRRGNLGDDSGVVQHHRNAA